MKLRRRRGDVEARDVADVESAPARPANGALLTVGRAIFGSYFLYNGLKHFRDIDQYAGYAESKGVPKPRAAVMGTGLLLVTGGLSLLTGVRTRLGASLIETFLVGVSPAMHAYWNAEGAARQAEQVNFFKNVALAGEGLMTAAVSGR
jgi:uncharacterized membrane protein YphA (DoxX/SURF4 family)